MRRGLAWLGGALGLAALLRLRRRPAPAPAPSDPAAELRAKLEQARVAGEDRDAFDAAEGQPVDQADAPSSVEERRRAIHERAQQALGEMRSDRE